MLESNEVKDLAFESIFDEYPEYRDRMRDYHLSFNAIDRHEKFRHIVFQILNRPGDVALVERMTRRFQELTRAGLSACPLVPGAQDLLEYLRGKVPAYLVSATPQAELEWIVEKRVLTPLLSGVYGTPRRKPELIRMLLERGGFSSGDAVFVGDSPEDLESARACDVRFIGRRGRSNFVGSEAQGLPVFDDLSGVLEHLRRQI